MTRAYAPHCDPSILHAPGACRYCDEYPDWQLHRKTAHIAFTGQVADDSHAPCPSEYFRSAKQRDAWPRNLPS